MSDGLQHDAKQKIYLVLGVSEILENSANLALFHAGLFPSNRSYLRRWALRQKTFVIISFPKPRIEELAANEDLDLLLQISRAYVFLDDISSDISDKSFPALRLLVDEVYSIKRFGVLGLECIKFLAEKNIFFGDVRVDEFKLGCVILV